jgi:hypothetical protein
MDRFTIRTEVRDIVGETVEDFWKDTELNRYIDEAQYRFSQEERWSWLITEGTETLFGGGSTIDLIEGVHQFRHMSIMLNKVGESTRMYLPVRVQPSKGFELRALYPNPSTYPQWYYVTHVQDSNDGVFIATIKFVPEPIDDFDVQYQYFRMPDSLSSDSSAPDCPIQFHKAIVHYAAGLAWEKELSAGPKASDQFQLYGKVVEQARIEERSQADDEVLAWGSDEPQYNRGRYPGGWSDPRWLIPETLGP